MIKRDFFEKIGLNDNQIELITEALEKESIFRSLLGREHVIHIESIMRLTDVNEIDFSDEDLLRSKIRTEFSDMIPALNWRKVSKVTL